MALVNLERFPEALASFDHALKLGQATALTYLWRGRAYAQLGQLAEALENFDRALILAPTDFEAHLQRGIVLARLERSEESLGSFDQAVRLDRNNADALNNRGAVLVRLSRPTEALDDFVNAVRCKPDFADAYTNLGNTQKGLGRYREALQSFDLALSLKPDDAMALWSKAVLKLAMGSFRDGWPLYEARLRLENNPLQQRKQGARWSGGESLEGRTLLVYAEQGLGDTLQFCRYIRPLEAMGARVVFEVQPVLKKLLDTLDMRGANQFGCAAEFRAGPGCRHFRRRLAAPHQRTGERPDALRGFDRHGSKLGSLKRFRVDRADELPFMIQNVERGFE